MEKLRRKFPQWERLSVYLSRQGYLLYGDTETTYLPTGEAFLQDMLEKLADYYDEEVESATEALLAAMEPLIIIVMAVIVVPIVLAIMMPMYSLYDSIGA